MSKVTFEFDSNEDGYEIALCTYRHKLAKMLWDISDYVRSLRKYEERTNIPSEEVEERLSYMLQDWGFISDM